MSDERKNICARQNGRALEGKIPIKSLWLDYHGTIVRRRAGALKRAVERALGRPLVQTAEEINAMIERVRLEFDGQDMEEMEGPEKWIAVNMRAFGCTKEQASLMSEYVCDESNYVVSAKRLKFVRWLLSMFPPQNTSGKYVVTASNADYTALSRFLERHGLSGVKPVSGDLMGIYKPNIGFYQRIIDVTQVPPENTLFIANSPRTDGRAARLGVNVVVILPPSVLMSPSEAISKVSGIKGRVFVVRSLMAARQVIARNFTTIR
jgi:hypothetical protein